MPTRQKISAIIVSIMMLSSVARGGVYLIEDDIMKHVFWVNTDGIVYRYGNQLLLPAVVTDYHGNIITTDAMVTYDAARGNNINLIHYGNYCVLAVNWNIEGTRCTIAQTSPRVENITWSEDWVYRIEAPQSGQNLSPLASKSDLPAPAGGASSGKDNVINAASRAADTAVANAGALSIRNSLNGDRYYLHDFYRVGDPNFNFYVVTLTVEPGDYSEPTEGLLFLQDWESQWGYQLFVAIITVFQSDDSTSIPYSMAGIYDPKDHSELGHWFAYITGISGTTTTVY